MPSRGLIKWLRETRKSVLGGLLGTAFAWENTTGQRGRMLRSLTSSSTQTDSRRGRDGSSRASAPYESRSQEVAVRDHHYGRIPFRFINMDGFLFVSCAAFVSTWEPHLTARRNARSWTSPAADEKLQVALIEAEVSVLRCEMQAEAIDPPSGLA
jgi:hypothetical protein